MSPTLRAQRLHVATKQSLFKEFKFTFKETFFDDDPLRRFKDQPRSKQLWLGIQAVFPNLEWGRRYELSMFKGDLIAGITIASLCILSSFIPPLNYAIMGGSRDIVIGPVAVVSLLFGSMLQEEIDPKNKHEYQRLAFIATLFAGVTQFVLGF
ncbi:UNVERIFIED_CONTAM: Sulfate transporter 1.3 [Sesamum angustifolium]|uniref:Sulfate transporter 1.3 n=1 Tax=Sesamum angustifolium TaxID=2727405 RepID=A0AAW2QBF6_9LAMI